ILRAGSSLCDVVSTPSFSELWSAESVALFRLEVDFELETRPGRPVQSPRTRQSDSVVILYRC
ncbi:uncharacterized protein MYCFIDRAFT_211981, partial [Pseudocercospora fijiensis CIRAD86]